MILSKQNGLGLPVTNPFLPEHSSKALQKVPFPGNNNPLPSGLAVDLSGLV
jgi:hypothetical protein